MSHTFNCRDCGKDVEVELVRCDKCSKLPDYAELLKDIKELAQIVGEYDDIYCSYCQNDDGSCNDGCLIRKYGGRVPRP